jgi:hypothetical protein
MRSAAVPSLLRTVATIGVGAAGFLAGASGLGTSGWPVAIAFLCGAGLIAATLRPDRIGFLGAWLGALAVAAAVTVGGDTLSDPEYGASFTVFFIAASAIVAGMAFGACFLGAALIRQRIPLAADRVVLGLAAALLLIGLLGVGLAPSVTPVTSTAPAAPVGPADA